MSRFQSLVGVLRASDTAINIRVDSSEAKYSKHPNHKSELVSHQKIDNSELFDIFDT